MRVGTKLVAAIVVSLALLEGLLWLAPVPREQVSGPSRFSAFLPGWNAYAGWFHKAPPFDAVFHSGRLAGVSTLEVPFHVNRYGFIYDFGEASLPKRKNEIRIAAVGGSTVECIALEKNLRWPHLVGSFLKNIYQNKEFHVYNLGISGQDTRTHIASIAQHAVKLHLDYIVFMLGANDLIRTRADFDIYGGGGSWGQSSHETSRKELIKWILQFSQIGRRLILLRRTLMGYDKPSDPEAPYFSGAAEGRRKLPLLSRSAEKTLRIAPPILEDYGTNLRSLAGLAKAHGIKTLFVTQPMLWKTNMTKKETAVNWLRQIQWKGKSYRLSGRKSAELLGSLNQELLAECKTHRWTCIDMATLIPRDLEHFYDSVHFNEGGARLVARIVAKKLAELMGSGRQQAGTDPSRRANGQ